MTGHSGIGSPVPDPDEACLDDASYVLGSLTPYDRLGYEKHLAGCLRCQASVQRLAGLPGLLALIGPDDVSELDDPADMVTGPGATAGREPLPSSLLPALLTRVAAERRRRRWIVGAVSGLAAACAIVLAVVLIARPNPAAGVSAGPVTSATPSASVAPIELTAVVPGPMDVSVALESRKWGTSITVNCYYESPLAGSSKVIGYELEVMDRNGRVSGAGSWRASGAHAVIVGATSLHPAEIASVRVALDDGTVILRGTP